MGTAKANDKSAQITLHGNVTTREKKQVTNEKLKRLLNTKANSNPDPQLEEDERKRARKESKRKRIVRPMSCGGVLLGGPQDAPLKMPH